MRQELPEELVVLVQVLTEDDSLAAWFLSLGELPAPKRQAALMHMAGQMTAAGEDTALVRSLTALVHPEFFEGVSRAVRSLRGTEETGETGETGEE